MHTNYSSITQFKQLVELKDYRPPTKKEYVRCVWKLAEHFECDPATLSENQVRQYFLFLRQELQCSASVMKGVKWALRCFYRECVKATGWTVFDELRIAEPKTVPVVLSRAEVQKVLDSVREARFAVCLRLMYHCGLRVGEAVSLEVKDIVGRQSPPRLHIRNAKGGKDRYVPLAPAMVEELRAWWRTHRNPKLVFPSPVSPRQRAVVSLSMSQTKEPMSVASVQEVFRLARLASGIHCEATTHTLRHSYATHLLEQGVSLRQISSYLGHESLDTTAIYTHLTAISEARTQEALAALYQPRKL
jgi:site-specific recombinase XerD